MKKILKCLLCILLSVSVVCGLFACGEKTDDNYYSYETVYAKAQSLGYNGTLEEFIALVSGKDGKDAPRISGVTADKGRAMITFTDGTSLNLGRINVNTDGQTYKGNDVVYPKYLWDAPDFTYCSDIDYDVASKDAGVKGIFFNSVPYNGKYTKVAGYIGFPKNASATEKVPAMVLVHGAGGTAFPQWVKYWNDLGYAAIAFDTDGREPKSTVDMSRSGDDVYTQSRYANGALDPNFVAGPYNHGLRDGDVAVENQWMFHASAGAIAACSLLSSFDCVDTNKIGITGISYGSIVTSVAIGYDDRFSFAMPVYGGITLDQSVSSFYNIYYTGMSQDYVDNYYKENVARWDTTDALEQTNCKVYYITSTTDFAFSMDIASRCAEAADGYCNYKIGFNHGHVDVSREQTIADFANLQTGKASDFVEIIQNPTVYSNKLKLALHGDAKVSGIKVLYTQDDAPYTGRPDGKVPNKLANFSESSDYKKVGENEYVLSIPASKLFYVRVEYADGQKQVCSYLTTGPSADIDIVDPADKFSVSDNFNSTKIEDSNVFESHNAYNYYSSGTVQKLCPVIKPLGDNCYTDDGYIVYKINAENGRTFKNLKVNMDVEYGHGGGANWYNGSRMQSGHDELGANLYVEYSFDNVAYTRIYDLNTAYNNCITKAEAAPYNPQVDLTAYAEGKTEIYIRIYMMHFTPEKINVSGWKDSQGNFSVWYSKIGLYINNVSVNGVYA